MKKTLVAVAALAAVTGAMAEVTISGFIDQAYNTTRSTTAAGVSTTQTALGPNAIGQDSLAFGVTEDLGGGLSAFANFNLIGITTTGWGATGTDNGSGIGLKGAFGTVSLGQGYSLVWQNTAGSDASGWGTGVGNVHTVGTGFGTPGGGIGYTLPEFVTGLSASIEMGPGEVDGSRNGNYQGARVAYSNSGFMISYAMGQYRSTGAATEWTTAPAVGNIAAAQQAITTGVTSSISSLTMTYDFGAAKVYGGYNSNQSGGNSNQTANSSTLGISVPLGAITAGIAASTASYRSAAAATVDVTGTRLLAKYAFSKRTSAYIQYGTAKISGGASATGNGIGLTHSF